MTLDSYRRVHHLSYAALGRLLGETTDNVWRWCNGKRVPGRDRIERIIGATDGACTAEDLLGISASQHVAPACPISSVTPPSAAEEAA